VKAPAKQTSFYVKWGNGALELIPSYNSLQIRAKNYEFAFEPRSIVIEGKYGAKREIDHLNRKTVFIEFVEEVQPLNPPRIDIVGRNYVGNFEVVYTDLEFERYLTVITPADFLYDYFVLTSTDLMLYMQSKRKIYYEEEPFDKIIIYIQ
jgi:hypothetical protein